VGESAVFRSTMRSSALAELSHDSFAMQKVVGSSPIIRFAESPAQAGFFVAGVSAPRVEAHP
jgi:hypothetical protein